MSKYEVSSHFGNRENGCQLIDMPAVIHILLQGDFSDSRALDVMRGLLQSEFSNGTLKGALTRHSCVGGFRGLRSGIGNVEYPAMPTRPHICPSEGQYFISDLLMKRLGTLYEMDEAFVEDDGVFALPDRVTILKRISLTPSSSPGVIFRSQGAKSNKEAVVTPLYSTQMLSILSTIESGSFVDLVRLREAGLPVELSVWKRKSEARHHGESLSKTRTYYEGDTCMCSILACLLRRISERIRPTNELFEEMVEAASELDSDGDHNALYKELPYVGSGLPLAPQHAQTTISLLERALEKATVPNVHTGDTLLLVGEVGQNDRDIEPSTRVIATPNIAKSDRQLSQRNYFHTSLVIYLRLAGMNKRRVRRRTPKDSFSGARTPCATASRTRTTRSS